MRHIQNWPDYMAGCLAEKCRVTRCCDTLAVLTSTSVFRTSLQQQPPALATTIGPALQRPRQAPLPQPALPAFPSADVLGLSFVVSEASGAGWP